MKIRDISRLSENNQRIEKIRNYASKKLEIVDAGHGFSHVERVLENARHINASEKGNWFLIEAGVLLHDVTDEKLFDKARAESELHSFLIEINLDLKSIQSIFNIINAVSFGGEFDHSNELSVEQKVVRDADRLDAIGAIGIARTFHYGGSKNREIFNPGFPPQKYNSTKEYRQTTSPTINHFYEKLLLLKDRMETSTGKKIAEQRHQFMLDFLSQFYKELGVQGFKQ